MNLLEENKKPDKTKGQKIILGLLITSVILLLLTIGIIVYFIVTNPKTMQVIKYKIDNVDVQTSQEFLISTTDGDNYVELKELAKLLNYNYFNGGYLEFSEDKEKCYIDNGFEIIQMEKDSNIIYKTRDNNKIGFQKFEISKKIIYYNEKLYINILDLPVALNLMVQNGSINKLETAAKNYQSELNQKGYSSIDSDRNNLKTIAYNLIVINKNSKKGIVNNNFEEIIGAKYDNMKFIELTKDFIVSSNNMYGIIKQNGETKVKLVYDNIDILSYSPLLYVVKKDNKLGIINENGEIVADILYDKIGYDQNKQLNIEHTVFIPEIVKDVGQTIVVSIDKKYGLIEIEKKKPILNCICDGIYISKIEDNVKYIAKINENEYNLIEYIEYAKAQENKN